MLFGILGDNEKESPIVELTLDQKREFLIDRNIPAYFFEEIDAVLKDLGLENYYFPNAVSVFLFVKSQIFKEYSYEKIYHTKGKEVGGLANFRLYFKRGILQNLEAIDSKLKYNEFIGDPDGAFKSKLIKVFKKYIDYNSLLIDEVLRIPEFMKTAEKNMVYAERIIYNFYQKNPLNSSSFLPPKTGNNSH